jgi:hypothetical protein
MPVPSEMPGMTVPEDEKDASLVSNAWHDSCKRTVTDASSTQRCLRWWWWLAQKGIHMWSKPVHSAITVSQITFKIKNIKISHIFRPKDNSQIYALTVPMLTRLWTSNMRKVRKNNNEKYSKFSRLEQVI